MVMAKGNSFYLSHRCIKQTFVWRYEREFFQLAGMRDVEVSETKKKESRPLTFRSSGIFFLSENKCPLAVKGNSLA